MKNDFLSNHDKYDRCIKLGNYILQTNATVRETAKVFGVSKSTVHHDVTASLLHIDPSLHKKVKSVLEFNKQERHIRGGNATKIKYQRMKDI